MKAAAALSAMLACVTASCSTVRQGIQQVGSNVVGTTSYFPVENFQTLGDEITAAGRVDQWIERVYDAPYAQVWSATERIARRLDSLSRRRVGGMEIPYRPLQGCTQNSCLVGQTPEPGRQLGDISRVGGARSNHNSWVDEFIITADTVEATRTRVRIVRRVIESSSDRNGLYFTLVRKASSGNYERWILTQIDHELTRNR